MGTGLSISISYDLDWPRQWLKPYPTVRVFRLKDNDEWVLRLGWWRAELDIRFTAWR